LESPKILLQIDQERTNKELEKKTQEHNPLEKMGNTNFLELYHTSWKFHEQDLAHEKNLNVLAIPDWCKDMPYKRYVHIIINYKDYRHAMEVQAPIRVVDAFKWKHILPSGIPIIEDG
jgi:hypothetical protein